MKIENIKTESLVPYARNAKLHDESQVSKIASSIREFGFNNPVLVDGEKPPGIIAGHGRVLAAKKLGLAEVPCIRLAHLTEAQKRAYILADNRLAELGGGWDMEMLKIELGELGDIDIDLDLTGFDENDLFRMTTPDAPEDFPEVGEDIATDHECPKCGYKWSGGK
jgi:ParB-like chromosome segregation protein Spo0J